LHSLPSARHPPTASMGTSTKETQLTTIAITDIDAPTKPKAAPPPLSTFSTEAAGPVKLKKVALIYNPVSGNKKGKKRVDGIVKPMFAAAGVEVHELPTERAGHATELAANADLSGCDALLAFGGDGTLSDVTTGFLQRQERDGGSSSVVLGFLPGGTGNTICHDIYGRRTKGDKQIRQAIEVVLAGYTRQIDACSVACTGLDGQPLLRHSINIVTAGLGVDANAAAEKRRWMGPMRYDVSIIGELLKIHKRKPCPCTLTVDGQANALDLFVLTIMDNKHSGVGLRISPYAQIDDGKIDIMYTPQPIKSVSKALKLDGMIKKKGKHVLDTANVAYTTATEDITLTSEGGPVRVMCDGDSCGVTPLTMKVLPRAVTVLSPQTSPKL